ncbi:MAG: hypothetical protein AVDCRST_MAG89-5098, partial [uncultured Gemmatimonadetes bacterium]
DRHRDSAGRRSPGARRLADPARPARPGVRTPFQRRRGAARPGHHRRRGRGRRGRVRPAGQRPPLSRLRAGRLVPRRAGAGGGARPAAARRGVRGGGRGNHRRLAQAGPPGDRGGRGARRRRADPRHLLHPGQPRAPDPRDDLVADGHHQRHGGRPAAVRPGGARGVAGAGRVRVRGPQRRVRLALHLPRDEHVHRHDALRPPAVHRAAGAEAPSAASLALAGRAGPVLRAGDRVAPPCAGRRPGYGPRADPLHRHARRAGGGVLGRAADGARQAQASRAAEEEEDAAIDGGGV